MQDLEKKVLIGFGIFAGLGFLTIPITNYAIKKKQLEADIKKAEIEGQYPSEYWEAKKAEAEATASVKKAQIESEERLVIDLRKRGDEEAARKREFEKTAPPEYWEQQRVEEEERTKRELNEQRYKTEREAAKQHQKAIEYGFKTTERVLRDNGIV